MSNHKFTPGPWTPYEKNQIVKKTETLFGLGVHCGGGPHAFDGSHEVACATAHTAEETEANAKLIAAAPELLQHLEYLSKAVKEGRRNDADMINEVCFDIIKKATE